MKRNIILLLLLGGCAVGPDYQAPEVTYTEPWQSELTLATSLAPYQPERWWSNLNDPLLSRLIEEAADNNRDIAEALANIEQARALRREAAAGFFPTLDSSAGAERSRFSRQGTFGASSGIRNTFSAGLDASWEIDLFGRTQRTVEAADAGIEASEAERDGMLLTVMADTAAAYFELRGLQRRLENRRHDIELLKQVEEIARSRFEAGVTSRLELSRVEGERQALASQLPDLEAQVMARIYHISVLTGQPPEFHADTLQAKTPLALPADPVPVGLRSDILKRRPDIRQAERELAAATAAIGMAKADLFPSFSLTGAIGTSARVFSDLFTPATMTGSLGAMLGWPVFQGGALMARVDAAEAEQKAALAAYEQAVLLALEDTEGALMRYGKAWQTLKRLKQAEASLKQASEIARLRYEAGAEDFMVILDAERALIATRNDVADAETAILTSLTQLYKSLGGGWRTPVQD